jgi:hypothetical protein
VLLDGHASTLLLKVGADLLAAALPGRRVAVLGKSPADWLVIAAFGATLIEAWTAPALLNGWVNYGAGFNPVGYWRDPHGVVHLRGVVKSGATATSVIFVLPAGYRPANREAIAVDAGGAFGRVDVLPSGDVTPVFGSVAYMTLDGITFRAG